jgi:hypothetical protein
MAPKDVTESVFSVDHEKLNELFRMIAELAEKFGGDFNIEHVKDILRLDSEHWSAFREGTSNSDAFLTIAQIEEMMRSLERRLKEVEFKALVSEMEGLKGEGQIIAQKKKSTSKKG